MGQGFVASKYTIEGRTGTRSVQSHPSSVMAPEPTSRPRSSGRTSLK